MGRRRNKGDGVVKEGEGKTGKSVQQARTLILLLSLPLPLSVPPLSPLETCRLSRRTHKGLQQAVPLLVPLSLPLPLPLPLPLSLSAPLLKPSRRTHKPCRCHCRCRCRCGCRCQSCVQMLLPTKSLHLLLCQPCVQI